VKYGYRGQFISLAVPYQDITSCIYCMLGQKLMLILDFYIPSRWCHPIVPIPYEVVNYGITGWRLFYGTIYIYIYIYRVSAFAGIASVNVHRFAHPLSSLGEVEVEMEISGGVLRNQLIWMFG
jgi:hypothetical protein